jgi:hypothetical protein
MKKNLVNKAALTATFFLTIFFSCRKDPSFMPGRDADFQSSETLETSTADKPAMEAAVTAPPVQTAAAANPVVAPTNPVVVPVNPADWKLFQKTPIVYKHFPMVGKNGAAIAPFTPITLKSGKKITASEYFARLNKTEKTLNAQGYTIRNSRTEKISAHVTGREFLEDMVAKHVKPIGLLRTEAQLTSLMSTTRQVGNIVLKPESEYTAAERNALNNVYFETQGDNIIAKIKNFQSGAAAPIPGVVAPVNPKALKTINEKDDEEWSVGKQSTIKAGVRGELTRVASIYQFNPQSPGTSMSSFRVIGKGNVYGYLLNKKFDLLKAEANFFAPADSAKKMTARVKADVAGFNIFNFNTSYPQKKTITGNRTQSINQSFPIEGFPIGGGLSFTGKIGVKGSAGLKYNATLGRGYVTASTTPSANISAYAEAGLEFLDFLGGGVGGTLTFIQGKLELRGSLFLALQNAEQIVVGYSHYFGVDLNLLKGRLYVYVEACVPFTDWCKRWEHDIFDWDGEKAKGTISEGQKTLTIANL